MNLCLFTMIVLIYVACDTRAKQEPDPMKIDAKSLEAGMPMTDVDSAHAALVFQAIDRQCGSCHHGDRSTNTGALAVFNLQEACWYCGLSDEQAESLIGRVSGSSFSDEERNAIIVLLDELGEKESRQ